MKIGDRVTIRAGRWTGLQGIVSGLFRRPGHRCLTVFVQVPGRGEWVGVLSEVRPAPTMAETFAPAIDGHILTQADAERALGSRGT